MSDQPPRADPAARPYRSGMAAGVGVVLLAGLVLGVVDAIHTGGAALPVLGLWALITAPLAIAAGAVLAGGNGTWGVGFVRALLRRLRDDDDFDQLVASILIACAVLGGALVLVIGTLAVGLVGEVNRKAIGGLLLGVVVVGLIPVFAAAAIPLVRAFRLVPRRRAIAAAVGAVLVVVAGVLAGKLGAMGVFVLALAVQLPAIGPIPRVLVLLVGAAVGLVLAGAVVIYTKLDYQALNLASLVVPALLPVVALAIGVVAYGPAAPLRERIPARGAVTAAGLVIALVIPVVGLGTPAPATRIAVEQRSYFGPRALAILRKLIDRDHDGYSAFFGGPDCDDHDPEVRPEAEEIAGNGKDDNCIGGDAIPEDPTPPPGTGTAIQPAPSTLSGGDHVVVIFIDTLRFDRLGIAGYRRDGKSLTPRIDALAAQSVVFDHAYAQAPNTPRSVPSFLASRYPTQVAYDKSRRTNYPQVLDDNDLLFEMMKPAGFTTIGMSSHFYFCDRVRAPASCDGVVAWMKSNIQQGADEWNNDGAVNIPESNKDVAGPRIVKKATARLAELAKAGGKFAMFVHLFEPHSTYVVHDGYPITEHGDASLEQRYDYEIVQVDQRVGELLDALDQTGLAKTTTVVLMSDHGEAFGVHRVAGQRMFFHGQTLYQELIHVPLIFRVPGVAPRTAHDVVQLLDLSPTLAALFHFAPSPKWQGRSLVPALDGKPLPPRPAYGELVPVPEWEHASRSMITADGKRHVLFDLSDWELYDLEADPAERKNLIGRDPDAEALKQQLASWIDRGR